MGTTNPQIVAKTQGYGSSGASLRLVMARSYAGALIFPFSLVKGGFTSFAARPKLICVFQSKFFPHLWPAGLALALSLALTSTFSPAQETPQTPATSPSKSPEQKSPELPAQIELLETRVRFEANGDSRKEVRAHVHINNELGARQFARLNFDYNRSFQQVELPLVRITHESGGTADILPGAITDQPNPAVVNFPAYHDVRVKSVRILGLEPGDTLEYRVVTTTTANAFGGSVHVCHDFSRDGVVSQEIFEIDLPSSWAIEPVTSRMAEKYDAQELSEGSVKRIVYRWNRSFIAATNALEQNLGGSERVPESPMAYTQADVVLSNSSWADLAINLKQSFHLLEPPTATVRSQAEDLTRSIASPDQKLAALYDFVSQKIRTVDLPLGATFYTTRQAEDVLTSGYGIPEDKAALLSALARSVGLDAVPALVLVERRSLLGSAIPDRLVSVLVVARTPEHTIWLDPSLEIAPFGVIASRLRGKPALLLSAPNDVQFFENIAVSLPFSPTQLVDVEASLGKEGTLKAKVHYAMRGDNELLLRVAFHQALKEKWKEVAQLLALSDGFRGKVTSVTASDPYATKAPFTVEYEITQLKFVDWSKKPVRIPALLPLLALPDPPPPTAGLGGGPSSIDLGTPLDVQTRVTLHVPINTSVSAPAGRSVERGYATFASKYSAGNLTLTAQRHIRFIQRDIPAEQASDYAAFVRAVQNDQAQEFTLDRATSPATHATPGGLSRPSPSEH